MAIEPIFEADFLDCSYGFRRNRSTHDAMAAVRTYMIDRKRMYYVIEGDIKSYFDTVHHKKLMSLLTRRIADKRLLRTIWRFLKAGIMEGEIFSTTEEGVPQGGGLSPLLANIYLHELDKYFYTRFRSQTAYERKKNRRLGGNNAGYIRFADDFVVLCNGHIADVRQLKQDIAAFLRDELYLTMSEEKTAITHVNDGFVFLGFRFYRGKDRTGQWKPKTVIPADKIEAVKEKIRSETDSSRVFLEPAVVVSRLNAVLRGWGNYYHCVPASKAFQIVDRYAFWRLVRWYALKFKISRSEVLRRFYTRIGGNRRLYATWKSRRGEKAIRLVVLTRDINFREYRSRKKGNPFLADAQPNVS